MSGTEIDLFIPPDIIIEIGYRDKFLMEKWDHFMEKGYEFIYISNIEVNNPGILQRYVNEITQLVEKTKVNSYRWNVMGFSSHNQKNSLCYNEDTDDGLKGVVACLESALREGAISVIVTRKITPKGKTHMGATHILSTRVNLNR